jgi:hypothetical protein
VQLVCAQCNRIVSITQIKCIWFIVSNFKIIECTLFIDAFTDYDFFEISERPLRQGRLLALKHHQLFLLHIHIDVTAMFGGKVTLRASSIQTGFHYL